MMAAILPQEIARTVYLRRDFVTAVHFRARICRVPVDPIDTGRASPYTRRCRPELPAGSTSRRCFLRLRSLRLVARAVLLLSVGFPIAAQYGASNGEWRT